MPSTVGAPCLNASEEHGLARSLERLVIPPSQRFREDKDRAIAPPCKWCNTSRPAFIARTGHNCWLRNVRRIAFAYHGEYMRRGAFNSGPNVCTDAFATRANHRRMLFDPLERLGVHVDVFLHAYATDCTSEAASASELVKMLRPVAFEIEPLAFMRHVDKTFTFVKVLRLVLHYWSGAAPPGERGKELLVLCRYESEYLVPIHSWNVMPTALNIAFRDYPVYTTTQSKASDLLFVAPRSRCRALLAALLASDDAGHKIFDSFERMGGGAPHFIDGDRWGTSNAGIAPFVSFVGLRRDCEGFEQRCNGEHARRHHGTESSVEAEWSDGLSASLRSLLKAVPPPPPPPPWCEPCRSLPCVPCAGAAL